MDKKIQDEILKESLEEITSEDIYKLENFTAYDERNLLFKVEEAIKKAISLALSQNEKENARTSYISIHRQYQDKIDKLQEQLSQQQTAFDSFVKELKEEIKDISIIRENETEEKYILRILDFFINYKKFIDELAQKYKIGGGK